MNWIQLFVIVKHKSCMWHIKVLTDGNSWRQRQSGPHPETEGVRKRELKRESLKNPIV